MTARVRFGREDQLELVLTTFVAVGGLVLGRRVRLSEELLRDRLPE